jgi:predicted PurR-regulated permease PerM
MSSSIQFISTLGAGVLIVFILNAGRDVLIPVALGVLVAFLLTPSVNWLQRRGLTNAVAVALVAFGVVGFMTLIAIMLWSSVSEFASSMPKYRAEITRKVSSVDTYIRDIGGKFNNVFQELSGKKSTTSDGRKARDESTDRDKSNGSKSDPVLDSKKEGQDKFGKQSDKSEKGPLEEEISTSRSNKQIGSSPAVPVYVRQGELGIDLSWKDWAGGAGAIFGPVGTGGLVTVFALFLLVNRDDLRDRFVAVISRGNYAVTTEAIADATMRISRYLVAQLILNVSYGVVFGIGLFLIGMVYSSDIGFPSLLFLSTVAGVVRFIPYFGPWIGATLPLAVAIAVFPGYGAFFAVLIWIILLEITSNNVVEPWFYGSSTGVSSIAIISSAVFWGWLWGIVGLLLATPLTVCLVVLGRYIPKMRFFVTLLSDEQQVKPDQRIYQRLLSGENQKIFDALVEEARERNAVEFIDQVVIPTTKRIMRNSNGDDAHDFEFAQTLLMMLQDKRLPISPIEFFKTPSEKNDQTTLLGDSATSSNSQLPLFYGVPARHPCESVILQSLKIILKNSIDLTSGESNNLPDREIEHIISMRPVAVIIISLPPAGMSQTKFWCKSLRKAGYIGEIIVVRPGRFRNFDQMLSSFRRMGATALTTSIAQTNRRISQITKDPTTNVINPVELMTKEKK